MNDQNPASMSRRCFLATTAGAAVCSGGMPVFAQRISGTEPSLATLKLKTRIRVGKVFVGRPGPGWPMAKVDLGAEVRQFEAQLAKMGAAFSDVEFVDGGMFSDAAQLPGIQEKLKDVTGILAIHLTLGTGGLIRSLMDFNVPVMIFTMPMNGHEWHIVAGWQREGRLVDIVSSSRYEDAAEAIRPFRAIQRLRETRILHISQSPAAANYTQAVEEKFGTKIISLTLEDLQKAFDGADRSAAEADARRWIGEAKKVVEPSREDVLKGSLMFVAMRDLMEQHQAQAVTMNCLGMRLIDRGMGYPCLGFVRLNNALLAGVCEADLKSTMTQLIFTYLVGRTGFVTDPAFDLSNDTIVHAHCVAATQMEGPDSKPSLYHIRTHLEDNRGVSLMVRMPLGGKVSMARLIGTDIMLFSTGDAVDSPFTERGCRSKLTMRVSNIDRFLSDWSCGLHRVIFYGDHTRDLNRFCRLTKLRLLREGIDDLHSAPGLEWETRVHA